MRAPRTTRLLGLKTIHVIIRDAGGQLGSEVHFEGIAEVGFPGDGVVGDLTRGPRDDDAALADDVGAIGDREGVAHVVVGDEDADAASLERGDGLLEVGLSAGGRARKEVILQGLDQDS